MFSGPQAHFIFVVELTDQEFVQIHVPDSVLVADSLQPDALPDEGPANVAQSSPPLDVAAIAHASLLPTGSISQGGWLAGKFPAAGPV